MPNLATVTVVDTAFDPVVYGDLPFITTETGEPIAGFPVLIPNSPVGPKTAVLRLPTSDELIEWFNAQKDLYKALGRGMSEEESVLTPKADQRLFRAVRLDKDGVEFDDAEALHALGRLTTHRVDSVERDGSNFIVSLRALFDVPVTHTIRIPYLSEVARYSRDVIRMRSLPNGYTEQRVMVQVQVDLYDKIVQSVTGYPACNTAAVPPHHKRTVVVKMMTEFSLLDSLGSDPN